MPPLVYDSVTEQKTYACNCIQCSRRKSRAKTTTTTEVDDTEFAPSTYDISMPPALSSTISIDQSVAVDEATSNATKAKGSKFSIRELYDRLPSFTLQQLLETLIGIFFIIYLVSLFHTGYKSLHPAVRSPATCALPANFDWRVQTAVEKALRRQRFDYLDHDPWDTIMMASMDTPEPQNIATGSAEALSITMRLVAKALNCAEKKKGVCDMWNKLAPEVRMEALMSGDIEGIQMCY
jgi:hypothetical protein